MHDLNQRGGGLAFEFQVYMSLSTFLAFRNPVLNFLNILNSRLLLSYKPLSYKKTCLKGSEDNNAVEIDLIFNRTKSKKVSAKTVI